MDELVVEQHDAIANLGAEAETEQETLVISSDDENEAAQLDHAAIVKKRHERREAELVKYREARAKQAQNRKGGKKVEAAHDKPPHIKKLKRFVAKPEFEVKQEEEKPKVKPASLSRFLEVPLDIISMVLGKLDPLSLLNVAYCNKQLHGWLNSKTAIPVWINARESLTYVQKQRIYSGRRYNGTEPENTEKLIAIPPRPETLTELAYARLCFGQGVCERPGCNLATSYVDFYLLKRFGATCQNRFLVTRSHAASIDKQDLGKLKFNEDIFHIMPKSASGYYYIYESKSLYNELNQMKANLGGSDYATWRLGKENIVAGMYAFGLSAEQNLQIIKRKQRDDESAERARVNNEKSKADMEKREQAEAPLHKFQKECMLAGDVELYDVKNVMHESDIGNCEVHARLKDADARAALQAVVVDRAERYRAFYLEEDQWRKYHRVRHWLLEKFRSNFAEPLSLLPPGDLYDLPGAAPFFAMVEVNREVFEEQWNESVNVIRKQALRRCLAIFQDLFDRAYQVQKSLGTLANLSREDRRIHTEDEAEIDALDLSIWKHVRQLYSRLSHPSMTFFECVTCREMYALKSLLSHEHITNKRVREAYDDKDPENSPWKSSDYTRPTQWRANSIAVPLEQSIAVHLLLKAIAKEAKHPDLPEGALSPPSNLKQLADFDKEWRIWCSHPSCFQRSSFAGMSDFIIDKEDAKFRRTFLNTMIHVSHHFFSAQAGQQAPFKTEHLEVIRAT